MMFEKDDDSNEFDKPSFDGRLQYYKVIKGYMGGIAEASSNSDFNAWFRLIRGLFALVKGFIEPSKATELKDTMRKLKYNMIMINNNPDACNLLNYIDDSLQDLTEDLFQVSKHLMLPITKDANGEFNLDELFRGAE